MDRTRKIDEQLKSLADHLATRRPAILEAWHKAVQGDQELTTPSALPRTQFDDHIPFVMEAYERKLRLPSKSENRSAQEELNKNAAEHGLHRWQQGYNLREVTSEWGHLSLCIGDELENYGTAHPDLESAVMMTAWRALTQLQSEGISRSAIQFFRLRQTEAEGHVRDLEQALGQVRDLERQSGELWRQAAHDLRGNLGVVVNVTAGLTLKNIPEPKRDEFVRLLQKSVASLHSMLEDVMGLARLQAAQERRHIESIDATHLLTDLSDNLQPSARERGLFLKAAGPVSLSVEGDSVKIRRITQNLLLNALKYTHEGGVTLSWGDSRDNDSERWMICVQDTGPGFHAGPGAPMAGALEVATNEARHVEEEAGAGGDWDGHTGASLSSASPTHDRRPVHQEPGEGIGLSIVKRLCELLDATLEMESKPGEGTIFRVILPRRYDPDRVPD